MNTIAVHTERASDKGLVTTLVGDLDADTAPALGDHLGGLDGDPDVIDLRFVPFMGAAGVTSLLHADQLRRLHGHRPLRVLPSPAVLRVLRLCGLAELVSPDDQAPALTGAEFGVSVHDRSLRLLWVNEALATMDGVSPAAHRGRRLGDLFDISDGDPTPLLQRALDTQSVQEETVSVDTTSGPALFRRSVHPVTTGEFQQLVMIHRLLPRLSLDEDEAAHDLHYHAR